MSDWDNLMEPARGALEALLRKGDEMADRIEELEALYEAAKHDAQEAEAYAEALEAKLYDIAQEELKPKGRGPWPNAIRAVNYRIGTNEDGGTVWAHRIEQYHEGRWTAIRVFNESEDGTLEEELSSNP